MTTCYTALQTKNITRSVSVINPVATENKDDMPKWPQRNCIALLRVNTLHCQWKDKLKEDKGKSYDVCSVHTYCSWDEAMSKSEEIKPVLLPIV